MKEKQAIHVICQWIYDVYLKKKEANIVVQEKRVCIYCFQPFCGSINSETEEFLPFCPLCRDKSQAQLHGTLFKTYANLTEKIKETNVTYHNLKEKEETLKEEDALIQKLKEEKRKKEYQKTKEAQREYQQLLLLEKERIAKTMEKRMKQLQKEKKDKYTERKCVTARNRPHCSINKEEKREHRPKEEKNNKEPMENQKKESSSTLPQVKRRVRTHTMPIMPFSSYVEEKKKEEQTRQSKESKENKESKRSKETKEIKETKIKHVISCYGQDLTPLLNGKKPIQRIKLKDTIKGNERRRHVYLKDRKEGKPKVYMEENRKIEGKELEEINQWKAEMTNQSFLSKSKPTEVALTAEIKPEEWYMQIQKQLHLHSPSNENQDSGANNSSSNSYSAYSSSSSNNNNSNHTNNSKPFIAENRVNKGQEKTDISKNNFTLDRVKQILEKYQNSTQNNNSISSPLPAAPLSMSVPRLMEGKEKLAVETPKEDKATKEVIAFNSIDLIRKYSIKSLNG